MADTMTVRAYIKGIDLTPRKVSVVASLVRGRTVADALAILDHTPAARLLQCERLSHLLLLTRLTITASITSRS